MAVHLGQWELPPEVLSVFSVDTRLEQGIEENHVYDLADPGYRHSGCVASRGIYKMAKRSNILASFYRSPWRSHCATYTRIVLAFKLVSGDTHSSGNHIWNRRFRRQTHSGLRGPIIRSPFLFCASMQVTESKIPESCLHSHTFSAIGPD